MPRRSRIERVVFGEFAVEEILPLTDHTMKSQAHFQFGQQAVSVHMDSLRYATFKKKGLSCAVCGCVGSIMRLEANPAQHRMDPLRAHFNLYAVTSNGLRLMTRDHIKPASLGGKDTLNNMRTACVECNAKRGNKPIEMKLAA